MKLGPHPFTLRQLQYVVAVAEHASFRRAAKACGVSQPSLSAQLAQVEDTLGVALFERGRGRVVVTAAGQALVPRARALLLDADGLLDAAVRLSDPLAGPLRLGIIPTFGPYLLPELAPALRDALPQLSISWVEDKTEALVRLLAAGELDGALVALEAELPDLEHEVVGTDPFVLAVPPAHPLGRGRGPVTLDALEGEPVLLLDDGHCFRNQALAVCAKAGAQELALRATSLPTLVQMVAGGPGITLLPRMAVTLENRRGGLRLRRFAAQAPARTVVLAWRRRSALVRTLHPVADVLRRAYRAFAGGRPPTGV